MFKEYKRTAIAEMRHVSTEEFANGPKSLQAQGISISQADLDAGSPTLSDMVARNPDNHADMWLVASQYFKANFELKD